MDQFEKGFFGLFFERRDLINKIVDLLPVLKENKGEKGHKENIQEDKKDVLGESSSLSRGEVPDRLGGPEEPGGQAVFDGLGCDDVGLDILEPGKQLLPSWKQHTVNNLLPKSK